MSIFGIRGSYGSMPDAAALADIGPGCRAVSIHCYSFDQLDEILGTLPKGMITHIQLNNEWKEVGHDWSGWESACKALGPRFKGRLHWVSCGGELDLWHLQPPVGKPDKRLTPQFAANLVNVASPYLRAAGIKVSTTSLASGGWPEYLQTMVPLCWQAADAVDLHLYVKKIANFPAYPDWQEASEALDLAHRMSGLPVICSEAGIKVDDAGGLNAQATWGGRLWDLTKSLAPITYPLIVLFAYSDAVGTPAEQGGQAFGMIGANGEKKQLYRVIQNACGGPIALPSETPPPPNPGPQPPEVIVITSGPNNEWLGSGLLQAINTRKLTPLTGELPGEGGTAIVYCAGGVKLRWYPWENKAYLERSEAA